MMLAGALIAFVFIDLYLLSQFLLTCPFLKQAKQQANFLNKPRLASTRVICVHIDEACCPKQYTQDTLSCSTTITDS